MEENKLFLLHRGEMEKRLDPFYYLPELASLETSLWKQGAAPLRKFIGKMASGATPKRDNDDKYYTTKESGIPFLRVQNVTPLGLDLNDVKFINVETHSTDLKRSQVAAGDLLITITGRLGSAAVAPEGFAGNINQHSVVIKTASREISELLAAYLNSPIGEKMIARRATGGTRPALDYTALRSIPILTMPEIVSVMAKAIVAKQQKEQQARDLLASIDNYLLQALGITLPPPAAPDISTRIFKTSWQQVTGKRLDPKRYSPSTHALMAAVVTSPLAQVPLKSLLVHAVAGDWGLDEEAPIPNSLFEKCLVIRATEFDNSYNLNVTNSRAKYRKLSKLKLAKMDVRPGDFLLEKSGGSPDQPVGRIALLEETLLQQQPTAFSNFIQKFRVDTNRVLPEYLFCFLKTIHNISITEAMQSQTNGIRNLIMREYWNQPVILPDMEQQRTLATHISSLREQARLLQSEARAGFAAAKLEIEQMILA